MLDIWAPHDETLATDIARFQLETTGEDLGVKYLRAHKCLICPYRGYEFVRLVIAPHLIPIASQNLTLSSEALSYALLARENGHITQILPFNDEMATVLAINRITKLSLDAENVHDYATVVGLVMGSRPVYFVSNINQVATILNESTNQAESRIIERIESLFQVDRQTGHIETGLKERAYVLLGKCFRLKMPCIFAGGLTAANMRIAENGTFKIDEEQPFNISGIIDRDAALRHYVLEFSQSIGRAISIERTRQLRYLRLFIALMTWERIVSIVLAPLFIFNIFLCLYFGQDTVQISSFMDLIKSSVAISLLSLLIGLFLIVTFVARLFVLNVGDFTNNLVPNVFDNLAAPVKAQTQGFVKKWGSIAFVVVSIIEFGIAALLALTVLSYGVFNIVTGLPGIGRLNFWETFVTVVWSIPLFGRWMVELVSTPRVFGVIEKTVNSSLYHGTVGFIFSTVLVGLIYKLFSYSRET